jgi:VanZ family protein
MWKARLVRFIYVLSLWLFWPGVALIVWGELTPHPPDLSSILGWDKFQHFIAYFGLASMATVVIGLHRRLVVAILGIIFLSGLLEILQAFTGRDPEVLDFIANCLGALVGTLVGAVFLLLSSTGTLGERPPAD